MAGRDFIADGTIEAAEVRDGDLSPDGRGIGRRAWDRDRPHLPARSQIHRRLQRRCAGENGKPVRLTMGSYGVGVSRLVAVIAEQQHDEHGLRWPSEVSPFDVHLVIANKDAEARTGGDRVGHRSGSAGHRGAARRPDGIARGKFKDAELLGVPWIVVVGRGWADGKVELRNRFSGETRELPVGASLATDVAAAVSG